MKLIQSLNTTGGRGNAIMNRNIGILFGVAPAYSAFADAMPVGTTPFASVVTCAEVAAEFTNAREQGAALKGEDSSHDAARLFGFGKQERERQHR